MCLSVSNASCPGLGDLFCLVLNITPRNGPLSLFCNKGVQRTHGIHYHTARRLMPGFGPSAIDLKGLALTPHHTATCLGRSCHGAASSISGLSDEQGWRIPEGRAEGPAELPVLPDIGAEVKSRQVKEKPPRAKVGQSKKLAFTRLAASICQNLLLWTPPPPRLLRHPWAGSCSCGQKLALGAA